MTTFLSEFREVLLRGDDLPTLPDVVFELHAALDDERVGPAEIASIINGDPALTTKLLRVANSAAFNRGTRIGNVDAAVQLLGLRQVRATCIVLGVISAFSGRSGTLSPRRFWTHCGTVGIMARNLGMRVKQPLVPAEELYVAGLLHDVGLLVLDQYFPDHLRELTDMLEHAALPLWKGEEYVLGTDHGEIGALLLGRWSLPRTIVDTIASHHHPASSTDECEWASRIIHFVELLCRVEGPALPIECRGTSDARAELERMVGDSADAFLEDVKAARESAGALV